MWLAAFFVILIGGFIADRAFKYYQPKAYKVFGVIIWTIDGILAAAALIGALYQHFTGSLP